VSLSSLLDLPTPLGDEPGPERGALEGPDVRIPGEMLRQERRPEVVEDRFSGSLQGSDADVVLHPVVGTPPPGSMDHSCISLLPEALAQSARVTWGEAHTPGGLQRLHRSLFQVPQHMDPITISEAQLEHLLPRCGSFDPPGSNKHRKRTFLN